jgi:hypothetical protein
MSISRRNLLIASAAGTSAALLASASFAALPPLAKKSTYNTNGPER